jgi:hypothetical protein
MLTYYTSAASHDMGYLNEACDQISDFCHQSFFGRYQHFAEKYSVGCVQMTNDGIENYILGVS